jgi:hypothetical protein
MGESHTLASTNPQSRRLYDYISRQDLMAEAAEASKKFRLYSRFALPHGSSYSLTCPHIDDGQRVEPCLCTVLLLLASIALQKSQQLDPHRLRVYLLRYTRRAILGGGGIESTPCLCISTAQDVGKRIQHPMAYEHN